MAQHWIATDFGGFDVFEFVDGDVAPPRTGEVTIEIRAVGMNPADYKHIAGATDRSILPVSIGYEAAGVITDVGDETEIASGAGAVGDEVIVFRMQGGYATSCTVLATNVFAKPANLGFPEAANLLLVGTTASEMLHVTKVVCGETIVVHGGSGAVGLSVIQQAKLIGARVIVTASEKSFAEIERFGGEPVAYGDGLEQRIRDLAPKGVDASLDAVGTDEAVEVSLATTPDPGRIATIAAPAAAKHYGFIAIGAAMPASAAYRDEVRAHLIGLASEGKLVVPMARTLPLADAIEGFRILKDGHPGGKLALVP